MSNSKHGVSVQAQLEMNDVPDFANEPGPGHYFGPDSVGFSALGPQRFAKHQSAPVLTWPKTGWSDWEKVRISKVHSRAYLGRDSPGAAYNVSGQLNKKSTKIGTSQRPPLSLVDPHGSPGPVYNIRDLPGQGLNVSLSEPAGRLKKGFGLAKRFNMDEKSKVPGPGDYPRKDTALQSGVGRSFGNARSSWEKVLTPGCESEGRCKASPGPGDPLRQNPQDGSKACPFGRAERFPAGHTDKSPGPGQYKRTERDVARTKQCLSDTPNPVVHGFGNKPTKPRFRCLLAQRTSANAGWGYF